MRRLLVFSSVVLLFCLPVAMNAQSASSATITGQVVDPQGAVVVGAKVTATNVATGIGRSANTTGSGDYTIPTSPLAPTTSRSKRTSSLRAKARGSN